MGLVRNDGGFHGLVSAILQEQQYAVQHVQQRRQARQHLAINSALTELSFFRSNRGRESLLGLSLQRSLMQFEDVQTRVPHPQRPDPHQHETHRSPHSLLQQTNTHPHTRFTSFPVSPTPSTLTDGSRRKTCNK